MEKNKLNIFKLMRVLRNMSVKEVADELDITTSYVNKIENGEKWPSGRLLRDYANALDISPEIFLGFKPVDGEDDKFDRLLLKILKVIGEM